MSLSADMLSVIAVMTVAAALCRLGGYWLMRFVPLTPRVQSALAAIPLAVMAGIIAPNILRGGVPETAGLIATVAAVKLGGNDIVAILSGLGTVAVLRQLL
ncbi:MAG: AzlD family protein [Hyphomicrobiaceae bacterium]